MISTDWFDQIPLQGLFIFTLLFVLLSIFAGRYLSTLFPQPSDDVGSLGSMVGAMLGLLAFMLAFTFDMTANRFNDRKTLLLEEVSAIGTTYLRAGMLSAPYANEFRELVKEYVDVRASAVRDPVMLQEGIARSEEIQIQLWSGLEELVANQEVTPVHELYMQALNEMISLHGKRVSVGLQFRIPGAIWFGLFSISCLAMIAVGFQFGLGKSRQLLFKLVLATAFSSVILLIADLDRPGEGIVKLNQQPIFELQKRLEPF